MSALAHNALTETLAAFDGDPLGGGQSPGASGATTSVRGQPAAFFRRRSVPTIPNAGAAVTKDTDVMENFRIEATAPALAAGLRAYDETLHRAPVAVPTARPEPRYFLEILQQWECVVRSVREAEFVATLHDITDPTKVDEDASFSVRDVAASDRALLQPGAVFYWTVGYEENASGQVQRISRIRFRRLPAWTRRERAEANRVAIELAALLPRP